MGSPAIGRVNHALKKKDLEVRWRAEFILKEIHEGSSWAGISAGFDLNHPEIKPMALTWRVGPTANRIRHIPRETIRLHLEIRRDQDGYVTISWNEKNQPFQYKSGQGRGDSSLRVSDRSRVIDS